MASKPVPQDHKQKEEKAKAVAGTREIGGREVEGFEVTAHGFTVFAHKEALDDFEVLDAVAKLDARKVTAFPDVLRRIIGDDFKVAMDGLRDQETGRVSIEKGVRYVQDVMGAISPNS